MATFVLYRYNGHSASTPKREEVSLHGCQIDDRSYSTRPRNSLLLRAEANLCYCTVIFSCESVLKWVIGGSERKLMLSPNALEARTVHREIRTKTTWRWMQEMTLRKKSPGLWKVIRGAKKEVAVDKRHTLLLLLHNKVVFTSKSWSGLHKDPPIPDLRQKFLRESVRRKEFLQFQVYSK